MNLKLFLNRIINYGILTMTCLRNLFCKKQFILFNTDNDKIIEYRLTNNLISSQGQHWQKHFKHMRLTGVIKKEIKYLSINN